MINQAKVIHIKDFQFIVTDYEIFNIETELELLKKHNVFNLKLILTVFILFIISLFLVVNAQSKHPAKKVNKIHLQPISLIIGQPTAWINNEDFVYDGFYIQSVSDRILVKFPTYMGTKIRAAIRIGIIVNVSGVLTTNLIGDKEMKLVKLTTDNEVIYNNKPIVNPSKVKPSIVKDEGKITQVQIDKEGKIKGYILDDKKILRVPIVVGEQLRNIISEGSIISYVGVNRVIADGEVSSRLYDVVICKTITVNGKEFLVKQ